MTIRRLTVQGLRGFATEAEFLPAQPNGESGSGLSVIVGPNGGGKSTLLEALRAAGRPQPPSFSRGKRNAAAGDCISIRWDADGRPGELSSIAPGSSETSQTNQVARLHYIPSRRAFAPHFGRSVTTREAYEVNWEIPHNRSQLVEGFSGRLIALERDEAGRPAFDLLVEEVTGEKLNWTIDQEDAGQYFIRIGTHTSDGLGEGTLSVLFFAEALFDSEPGDVIVIDEPELSLHPAYQRRLRRLLSRYATDRQIILATHSPYFIDWGDVAHGAVVARVYRLGDVSYIASPDRATLDSLSAVVRNVNNPHVLGTNASEIFFVEDKVILTEGQEDVVIYQAMALELDEDVPGSFFGWGTGGAERMELIATMLKESGFGQVVGILDGDKQELCQSLNQAFPDYVFFTIPAKDVRSKPSRSETTAVVGLAESNGRVADGREADVRAVFEKVRTAFEGSSVRASPALSGPAV